MDERRGSVVEGPSPPAVCGTAESERRAGPDRLAPFDQGPERLPRAVRAPAERVAQLAGPGRARVAHPAGGGGEGVLVEVDRLAGGGGRDDGEQGAAVGRGQGAVLGQEVAALAGRAHVAPRLGFGDGGLVVLGGGVEEGR